MPKPFVTRTETALKVLMKDFGYRFIAEEGRLIRCGVKGFTSDTILPYRFNSAFSAASHLIPIISQDDYHSRFNKLTTDK